MPIFRWFSAEFYQRFNEKLRSILHKLVQDIKEKRIISNSYYKTSITMIQIPDEDSTEKENYRPLPSMSLHTKFLNKNVSKVHLIV